jgi:hypothetical protein
VGSAAPLNISLPALALRLTDPPRGVEMPASWIDGVAPGGFEPWGRHGWLAVAVAAATLAVAVAALASRWIAPRVPLPGGWHSRALELCALLSAAMLAAPVGWYHYQICQLPAFAIVVEGKLAARQWRGAAFLFAMLVALTRAPAWLFGLYVERFGWTAQSPAALWIATSAGPLLATGWTIFLVREARAAVAVRAA